jgi:DNA-binding MarR family transcriptional regulator
MQVGKSYPKKIMLGMLIISVFVFIVAVSSLYIQHKVYINELDGCVIPVYLFVPFIGTLGLFIGTLAYYLFSQRFQEKKIDKSIIFALMKKDEAKIVRVLMERNGRLTQPQIARLTGMNKLQVFRAIERLEMKGVVEKKKDGKLNMITLTQKFRQLMDVVK